MKKMFYAFICFMFVLSACNKEESVINENPTPSEKGDGIYFYGVKVPENPGGISTKGVAQNNKLWHPTSTIKIKFLDNPDPAYVQIVQDCTAEWAQHISVKFEFVTTGRADVRLQFDGPTKYVTWSYTGTDCKFVNNQALATANFDMWDYKSDAVRRGDALRVLGQVLGLEFEHRHLEFDPQWRGTSDSNKEARVASYWANNIDDMDIDWDELKEYVFDPLEAASITQTAAYDPNSIMVWPFPTTVLLNTTTTTGNFTLSATDIEFIKTLYPKQQELIVTMKTTKQNVSMFISSTSDFDIDWGDGNRETITSVGNISHIYTNSGEHTIQMYGYDDAISQFWCTSCELSMIDVSKNTHLEYLTLNINNLQALDISKNTRLTTLSCMVNYLTSLDVSKNTELDFLACGGNLIESLDVTNNTKLATLSCYENKVSALDLSNNSFLGALLCYKNELSELDVRPCPGLVQLECGRNSLDELDVSGNIELIRLLCEDNMISELDISNLVDLQELNCCKNLLDTLDISANLELITLLCYKNQLNGLSISNNSKLARLCFHSNPFMANQNMVTNIANSLPDRTGAGAGLIYTERDPSYLSWISTICSGKNWQTMANALYY